jgi:hypothetical protein
MTRGNTKGKEMWDIRFSGEEYVYGTSPNEFFKSQIDSLKPGSLLLPGEGEGRNAVYAATRGWSVTAVDQSDEGKRKALRLAELQGTTIEYFTGDLIGMDFGQGLYDAAGLVFIHTPPGERKDFHAKVVSAVKPGGVIILEGFSKEQMNYNSGGPRDEPMLFSEEMLRDDFNALEILLLEKRVVQLTEGEFHKGEGSVIRMVAIRSRMA